MNTAAIWRPPDKEMAAEGKTPRGREKPNPSGTGGSKDTPIVSQWQRGIAPALVTSKPAVPEYATSWRAFVTWAVGQGYAPPRRMVDTIISEIETETA